MVRGRSNADLEDAGDAERIVPSELTNAKMRACMSCSMIKSMAQFTDYGCENCPFMQYEGDKERVGACTTNAFTGFYVMLKPKQSWVAKWQRIRIMHPGAYAISIDAEMPDDILEQLEENGIRKHRILATALKDKDKE